MKWIRSSVPCALPASPHGCVTLARSIPNSPVHIHAIAIGDAELSQAAIDQLIGPNGYFRSFTGFPDTQEPDRHGGPVLCQWMIDMGYGDLR